MNDAFGNLYAGRVTLRDPNKPKVKYVVFCTRCKSEKIKDRCLDEVEHIPMSMVDYTRRMVNPVQSVQSVMRYSKWEVRCMDCGYSVKYYKSR